MKLTAEQQAIVDAPLVPLTTVRALAGTGKTELIIKRITKLIEERESPQSIYVICFSRAAVSEIKSRLQLHAKAVKVRTLHSLCHRFLDKPVEYTDSAPYIELVSEVLQKQVVWSPPDTRTDSTLGAYVDSLLHYILPRDMSKGHSRVDRQLVKLLMHELQEQPWTTFSASLWQTLNQITGEPWLVEQLIPGCQHLISDEYQDVSPLQHALFMALAEGRTFTVVGDPSQSIYGFQGARPRLLEELEEKADQALTLSLNFRSPAHHLLLANEVLPLTGQHQSRLLIPTQAPRGGLNVHFFDNTSASDAIQQLVAEVQAARESSHSANIAVLARTNKMLDVLSEHLAAADIDFHRRRQKDAVLSSLVVRSGLTPLARLAQGYAGGPRTGVHPLAYMLRPEQADKPLSKFDLSNPDISLLTEAWHYRRKVGDFQALAMNPHYGHLPQRLESLLDIWSKVEKEVRRRQPLLEGIKTLGLQLWPSQQDIIEQVNDWGALLSPPDERPPSETSIELSTIHRAKGREWDYVFLYEGWTPDNQEPDFWDISGAKPVRHFADYPVGDAAEETR